MIKVVPSSTVPLALPGRPHPPSDHRDPPPMPPHSSQALNPQPMEIFLSSPSIWPPRVSQDPRKPQWHCVLDPCPTLDTGAARKTVHRIAPKRLWRHYSRHPPEQCHVGNGRPLVVRLVTVPSGTLVISFCENGPSSPNPLRGILEISHA